MKPIVWTIAGSDCSSGAGIQADLLTFNDLQVHGCALTSVVTAQNSSRVDSLFCLNPDFIKSQIQVLSEEFFPKAIKIGLLGSFETAKVIARVLEKTKIPTVMDPIYFSTSGARLMDLEALKKSVEVLAPYILFTP